MPNEDLCANSQSVNFLGFTVQDDLKWHEQILAIQNNLVNLFMLLE
jgi:hypothetical protein